MIKDSQSLLKCLATPGTCHSGLQSEERGLLFTIHTQFVLFNLNISPKSIMNFSHVREMVLKYLKTLFRVSEDVLQSGRMASKNQFSDGNISGTLALFHEESAILNVLHLTLIALINSPMSMALEVIGDIRKICQSGLAFQKLVSEESAGETWVFLFHLNTLSSTFLSMVLNSMINDNGKNVNVEQTIHPDLKAKKRSMFLQNCDASTIEKIGK